VHPGDRIRHQVQHLTHLANRLGGGWRRYSEAQSWEVRGLARALAAAQPDIARSERERVDLGRRLRDAARGRLDATAARVVSLEAHLKHLNPDLVLERGYSIALNAAGAVVHDAVQIALGDELRLTFARGSAQAEVKSTQR
jgi:exodeoxyribonuclease VII large subunit